MARETVRSCDYCHGSQCSTIFASVGSVKLFLDMDGCLVHQTSRKRFDLMPWMPDGKELWEGLKPYQPTLLSQLMIDIYDISAPEKRTWVNRELGSDIRLIVVHGEQGKWPYSRPGHVLIDDSIAHRDPWEKCGGTFILHKSAKASVSEFLEVVKSGLVTSYS